MSGEIQTVGQKTATVRAMFEARQNELSRALPKHIPVDALLRVALNQMQANAKLLDCTPVSLYQCLLQCASLGLVPDGLLGYAYLIPYGTKCTLIIGYKGLLQLARQSGQILTLNAYTVHEKDFCEVAFGDDPRIRHEPNFEVEDRGQVTGAYAVATLKGGGKQFEYMSIREIEKVRKSSSASSSGPWTTHYEEMCKKTTLRRLCKLLPASTELQRAVSLDEAAEIGRAQFVDSEPTNGNGKRRDLGDVTKKLTSDEQEPVGAEA